MLILWENYLFSRDNFIILLDTRLALHLWPNNSLLWCFSKEARRSWDDQWWTKRGELCLGTSMKWVTLSNKQSVAGARHYYYNVFFAHRRTLSENSISTSCSKSPRSWTKVEVPTKRSKQPLSQRGAATGFFLKALTQNPQRRARKTNNVSCSGSSKYMINRSKNAGRLFSLMWNRLLGKKKTTKEVEPGFSFKPEFWRVP